MVATSYCFVSFKLRWFTLSSTFPKPIVDILPANDTFAISAKFASAFITAAQPPLLSKPAERNSLNQISPLIGEGVLFFRPKTMVFNCAKVGFPFTEIVYKISGSCSVDVYKSVIEKSSLSLSNFTFPKVSKKASKLFASGHRSKADVPFNETFKGNSI